MDLLKHIVRKLSNLPSTADSNINQSVGASQALPTAVCGVSSSRSLPGLPDDLLLEIASHLDIDSLLVSCRLCRRIRSTVLDRITSLAETVAKNTFPEHRRLLQRHCDEVADYAWLTGLRYRALGAIVLEHHAGIAAEDPLGDRMRRKLACGFRVIDQMSREARSVREGCFATKYLDTTGAQARSVLPLLNGPLGSGLSRRAARAAREIARRWSAYINTLGLEEFQGLVYLWGEALPGVFHPSINNTRLAYTDLWKCDVTQEWFGLVPWALWQLFHAGCGPLWRAWYANDITVNSGPLLLPDWLQDTWRACDRLVALVQCEEMSNVGPKHGKIVSRRNRIYIAIRERYPEEYNRIDWVKDVHCRTKPVVALRRDEQRTLEAPAFHMMFSYVPFSQHVRFKTLGLEKAPEYHVMNCAIGPYTQPTAKQLMDDLHRREALEDKLLEDVKAGRVVLPV